MKDERRPKRTPRRWDHGGNLSMGDPVSVSRFVSLLFHVQRAFGGRLSDGLVHALNCGFL